MIKHAWTVICQKSIIDVDTNNIFLDVLEQLNVTAPPVPSTAKGIVFPIRTEIVSLWYRTHDEEPTKADGRVRVEASNGENVVSTKLSIDLTKTSRARTRARLAGLPLPKGSTGYYYAIVELQIKDEWIEVSRVPLEVNLKQTLS